jgi:hypothetical protein
VTKYLLEKDASVAANAKLVKRVRRSRPLPLSSLRTTPAIRIR